MTVVSTAIDIAAPPERVWDVVLDPRRLGDWVTIHRSIGDDTPTTLRRGSTFEQTMNLRGAHLHVEWTVAELQAPHRAEWHGRGPARSNATILYELVAMPGGGTRFTYTNEFSRRAGRSAPSPAACSSAGCHIVRRSGHWNG